MNSITAICMTTIFGLFEDNWNRIHREQKAKDDAYQERNKYRIVVVVRCKKTNHEYPVWRDLLPRLKKDWCCPQCGRFIYRANKKTQHEVDESHIQRYIKDKCKHPFVWNVMVDEVFGFSYHSVKTVLIRYDSLAVPGRKGEYEAICKNCRRYMRYLQGKMNLEDSPEEKGSITDEKYEKQFGNEDKKYEEEY